MSTNFFRCRCNRIRNFVLSSVFAHCAYGDLSIRFQSFLVNISIQYSFISFVYIRGSITNVKYHIGPFQPRALIALHSGLSLFSTTGVTGVNQFNVPICVFRTSD
uniref:Uncharacterized protein n=1 Tax=Cacopsylla melanoneura TaxID=428564 RepID=A0A8D8TBN4_9HEMI